MYTLEEIKEKDAKIQGMIKELHDMTYPIGESGQDAAQAILHLGYISSCLHDIIMNFEYNAKHEGRGNMNQEPLGATTRNTMERVRLEWIANYRTELRKKMDALFKREPMSDFDEGYNSALDECLKLKILDDKS